MISPRWRNGCNKGGSDIKKQRYNQKQRSVRANIKSEKKTAGVGVWHHNGSGSQPKMKARVAAAIAHAIMAANSASAASGGKWRRGRASVSVKSKNRDSGKYREPTFHQSDNYGR